MFDLSGATIEAFDFRPMESVRILKVAHGKCRGDQKCRKGDNGIRRSGYPSRSADLDWWSGVRGFGFGVTRVCHNGMIFRLAGRMKN